MNFYYSAAVIKQRLGFPRRKTLPIKELIRSGQFLTVVKPEIHCEIFDFWPLRDQLDFMDSLSGMSAPEKEVHIYEKVYGLCRHNIR